MKKTFLGRGAIIATCAAIFLLGACSQTEFDGRTDTVYSLDAPSVTAKAYPGVNIVSWKPVTGASSYNLTIYEDEVKVGEFKNLKAPVWHSAFLSESDNQFNDNQVVGTGLINGKKYTYYVEAVSSTNPGTAEREVYAKNSRGEASATAIVPPAGTSALLLPAFEGGYDGKEVNVENAEKKVKDDKFVVSSENITVSADKNNIYVNFPAKAYLGYGISLLGNDLPNEADVGGTWGKWVANSQANNTTIAENIRVFNPGEYKVKISVKSFTNVYVKGNQIYNNYDYDNYLESVVESKATVTIESLGLTVDTNNVSAAYLSDGKTARISFEPAKKDGIYVPTSLYKVYRHVKGEYATTEVTGIKESISESATKTYYVDDAITDNKQVYEYIVVVTDGTKYGKSKTATLGVVTATGLTETGAVTAGYLYNINHFATSADNTVRISFTPAQKDGKPVPTTSYKVYRSESGKIDQTEITSDTNKIILDDADSNTYVVYDKVTDPAKAYTYTVVVFDDGRFAAIKGDLKKAEKRTLSLVSSTSESETNKKPVAQEVFSTWNDLKWTIVAKTSVSDDIKNITKVTAYLLVTPTTQIEPKANEVIDQGTPITMTRDTEESTKTKYVYTFSKSGLSSTDAQVFVVVKAECDGYEDAISEVGSRTIYKRE
ncbi:MAG: hypothetical protein K2N58_08895 [Treponemataceae bacterium]|nr:hypothetical protein [Treponemataceae bacterium]